MIQRYKEWHGDYTCDDCGAHAHYVSYASDRLDVTARAYGWAISKDHEHCYCPKCAEAHRCTGMYGAEYKRRWYTTS